MHSEKKFEMMMMMCYRVPKFFTFSLEQKRIRFQLTTDNKRKDAENTPLN